MIARAAVVALILAVAGCPARKGSKGALTMEPAVTPAEARTRVEGPTRWVAHQLALCVEVPEGWVGWADDGGAMLTLSHDSGVAVGLFRGRGPISRPGFTRVFEDDGRYRDVPLLYPSSTVTWISEDPSGPTLQEWVGYVDQREVRVEVTYPPGHVVEGRHVAEGLLQALCRP